MKVVIMGCGRVGSTLATLMDQAGHRVTVIDSNSDSFQRLRSDFKGEKIAGNGVDEEILRRAGIEKADAFAAVTNGDNRNIMASQIAKEIFNIKKVVCRIYDPIRESTYRELGMETFCPTLVGADILFNSLTDSKKAVS
ncbi:MAG: TrkA family potassium uptake protein [Chloroflexota bacterium]|nr:TrkA family potassium uptake protein [Chloroflexota bacterium]